MKKEEIDKLTQECLETEPFKALVAERGNEILKAFGGASFFRRPLHADILVQQAQDSVRGDITKILEKYVASAGARIAGA